MEIPTGFGVEGSKPIEWVIILDTNIYSLKDTGMEWFEKLKEGLEAIWFVKSHVDHLCMGYRKYGFTILF